MAYRTPNHFVLCFSDSALLSLPPGIQRFLQYFCMANSYSSFNIQPANGHEESFWNDETVLYLDCGNGYMNLKFTKNH